MRKKPGSPPTRQPPTLAAEIRVLVGTLKRRLREEAHPGNLTWSQMAVLGRLERDGPVTVTQLARAEGMRPQSMGATVSMLMAAGLLVGEPHPTDGRQTLLSLTDRCRELIKASRAARDDWLTHAIQNHLTAQEQEALATGVELLKRIADS